jgi:NADPH:quinone reductase
LRACIYDHTGSAREVLRIVEVDRPEPGTGEVRVRVHLSGVNPTDVKSRAGITPRPIDGFQVPHHDGSGQIDAVGPGVDPGRIGERVWVWMAGVGRWGTAAEWSVVPAEQAVVLADGASDGLGAGLGVPAMTAHRCLFADGPVEGASILVAGGAGAVGHYAIELARHAGARVATTVSGPEKAKLAALAGADLIVNYREADALSQLRNFSPVMDRIIEVNLPANLDLDLNLAGPPTTVVTYAATSEDATLPTRRCMTANVKFRFVLLYGIPRADLYRAAAEVEAAVAAGALTELPLHVFPLAEVAAAHEAVEHGVVGKVVVDPRL